MEFESNAALRVFGVHKGVLGVGEVGVLRVGVVSSRRLDGV